MKAGLFIISMLSFSAMALENVCELEKASLEQEHKLEAAVNSQFQKTVALGETLISKNAIQDNDLAVLNDPNHDQWFAKYDEYQKKLRLLSGKDTKYVGIDDQGLMLQQLLGKIVITTSSKKISSLKDLSNLKPSLIALTINEKHYASIEDFYISQLSKNCQIEYEVKVTKDPLIGDIQSFSKIACPPSQE